MTPPTLDDDALAAAAAVDQDRLWHRLMEIARFGATPRGGVNRQAFSAEDAAARRQMAAWAEELGLSCLTDEIGNLYLRRAGRDPDAAPVMTGSHLDSQPTGGKFDGAYGVIAGLEALHAISAAGLETARPIELVAWSNEEGSRYQPGLMGSGVFSGDMAVADLLPITDGEGISVETALADLLAATPGLPKRPAAPPAAYVEAHIEQGPILEREARTIGVVGGVQGMRWFTIEVLGEAAHAGTTPRSARRDALKAAARMVTALEEAFADAEDILRFTVGRFEVEPGSPNTVPARALFSIDFRHPDAETIERLCGRIEDICRAQAGDCPVTVTQISGVAPCLFDPAVVGTVRDAAERLALPRRDIMSGAGHDAMNMAGLCPTGMIFVPCEAGVSHNEAENARPEDLAAGTRVLAASLVALANA